MSRWIPWKGYCWYNPETDSVNYATNIQPPNQQVLIHDPVIDLRRSPQNLPCGGCVFSEISCSLSMLWNLASIAVYCDLTII